MQVAGVDLARGLGRVHHLRGGGGSGLRLHGGSALLAQGGDLAVGQDDLRADAVGLAVLVDDLVEVELVQHVRLDGGHLAHGAEQSVHALGGHRTLCLRQHADELDVQVHALELGRGLGQDVGTGREVERDVDQRRQQLVVQTLEHGAEHQELLFVALGDLGGGDARAVVVGQHQEQVRVVGAADALAHVLDVDHQVLQVQVDVERRAHALVGAHAVDEEHAARQAGLGRFLVLGGHLQGRVDLVVDRLALAQLLVLQLLHIAQALHAGAGAVHVVAGDHPTRGQHREAIEPRLGQELVVLVLAGLDVAGGKAHVLAIALAVVALLARLDDVDHVDPGVVVGALVEVAHGGAAVLFAELLDHLGDGQLELAHQRVDLALAVGGERVLADRQRVVVDDVVEVGQHDRGPGAEEAELLVHRVQAAVGVGGGEDRAQQGGGVVQPGLDRAGLHQVLVLDLQPKPRTRRARHTRHQASGQRASAEHGGVVQDVVGALVAPVAIGDDEPPSARLLVVTDLAPVSDPARALVPQRALAREDALPLVERLIHH